MTATGGGQRGDPTPRTLRSPRNPRSLRLAVLLSGGGTTLQNLAEAIVRGEVPAQIGLVIASNAKAGGLQRASNLGLPAVTLSRNAFASTREFSVAVFTAIRDARADLVCLAGFLSLLAIPDDYAQRVINIHPSLLPAFGGKGMHGRHVHEAVLAVGCKVSGCTVHFADQTYDTGPILVQRCCPVRENDTPDSLAKRVFEQECLAYPEAVRLIAAGLVQFDERRVRIL